MPIRTHNYNFDNHPYAQYDHSKSSYRQHSQHQALGKYGGNEDDPDDGDDDGVAFFLMLEKVLVLEG